MNYLHLKQMATKRLRELASDERGVTALEYALIAAVVVVVVSSILPGIGSTLGNMWTGISNSLA